jgi:hypothetical protein
MWVLLVSGQHIDEECELRGNWNWNWSGMKLEWFMVDGKAKPYVIEKWICCWRWAVLHLVLKYHKALWLDGFVFLKMVIEFGWMGLSGLLGAEFSESRHIRGRLDTRIFCVMVSSDWWSYSALTSLGWVGESLTSNWQGGLFWSIYFVGGGDYWIMDCCDFFGLLFRGNFVQYIFSRFGLDR